MSPYSTASGTRSRATETRGRRAFSEGGRAFGLRQMLVNKRERCVDDFLPYPGIVRNTCENQSELWLGGHQVLRGGG